MKTRDENYKYIFQRRKCTDFIKTLKNIKFMKTRDENYKYIFQRRKCTDFIKTLKKC